MDEDEGVVVTTAPGEVEAEVLCGFLRSAGIDCGHRVTEATDSLLDGFASDGPREILVPESELEAARAVLADAER
jgi:Putative prokaryotic signal transducing protein